MRILFNGVERDVPLGITVSSLLKLVGVKMELVAVELNGNIIPRDRHDTSELNEGDVLEIIRFVGGG